MTRQLAVVVFVLLFAGCGPSVPKSTDGKQLFESVCAKCHAFDGRGVAAMRERLNVPDMTDPAWQAARQDDDIVHIIRNGSKSGKMPPLGRMFTEQQERAIVAHVRTLGR